MDPTAVFRAEVAGIELMRPNNLLSNLLVVAWCAFLAWKLVKEIPRKSQARAGWVQFFVWTAYAALVGGIAHAFNYGFPAVRHTPWHKIAWIGGGLSMFFLAWTAAETSIPPRFRRIIQGLQALQMLIFASATVWSIFNPIPGVNAFVIPRTHIGVSLILWVLPIHLYSAWRGGPTGWQWLFAALLSLATTVPFYNANYTPVPWFDYNDISHLIEMVAIYCFFRAAKKTLGEVGR